MARAVIEDGRGATPYILRPPPQHPNTVHFTPYTMNPKPLPPPVRAVIEDGRGACRVSFVMGKVIESGELLLANSFDKTV